MENHLINLLYLQIKHDYVIDRFESIGAFADCFRIDIWSEVANIIGLKSTDGDFDIWSDRFYELYLEIINNNVKVTSNGILETNSDFDESKIKVKLRLFLRELMESKRI